VGCTSRHPANSVRALKAIYHVEPKTEKVGNDRTGCGVRISWEKRVNGGKDLWNRLVLSLE